MLFHSIKQAGPNDFALYYAAITLPAKVKPAAICRLLDTKPRTLQRYLNGKANPPAAMVRLLFMESFYGVSAVTMHSQNGEMYARKLADSLKEELARVAGHILDLELENADLRAAAAQGADSRQFAANSSRFGTGR